MLFIAFIFLFLMRLVWSNKDFTIRIVNRIIVNHEMMFQINTLVRMDSEQRDVLKRPKSMKNVFLYPLNPDQGGLEPIPAAIGWESRIQPGRVASPSQCQNNPVSKAHSSTALNSCVWDTANVHIIFNGVKNKPKFQHSGDVLAGSKWDSFICSFSGCI